MSRHSKPCRPGRLPRGLSFGLFVIGAGLVMLLVNLGRMDMEVLLNGWPALLILGGLIHLVDRGFLKIWGHLLITAGLILLAGWNGHAEQADRWWPLGLVWVGALVTVKALWKARQATIVDETANVCQDEPGRDA